MLVSKMKVAERRKRGRPRRRWIECIEKDFAENGLQEGEGRGGWEEIDTA